MWSREARLPAGFIAGSGGIKLANPKAESRSPKEIRKPKAETISLPCCRKG
jgi:hypothetical protein